MWTFWSKKRVQSFLYILYNFIIRWRDVSLELSFQFFFFELQKIKVSYLLLFESHIDSNQANRDVMNACYTILHIDDTVTRVMLRWKRTDSSVWYFNLSPRSSFPQKEFVCKWSMRRENHHSDFVGGTMTWWIQWAFRHGNI